MNENIKTNYSSSKMTDTIMMTPPKTIPNHITPHPTLPTKNRPGNPHHHLHHLNHEPGISDQNLRGQLMELNENVEQRQMIFNRIHLSLQQHMTAAKCDTKHRGNSEGTTAACTT